MYLYLKECINKFQILFTIISVKILGSRFFKTLAENEFSNIQYKIYIKVKNYNFYFNNKFHILYSLLGSRMFHYIIIRGVQKDWIFDPILASVECRIFDIRSVLLRMSDFRHSISRPSNVE